MICPMPHRTNLLLVSIALVAVAATGVAVTTRARPAEPVAASAADAEFTRALQFFRAGHHAAAYGRLARLADGGHVGAARLALVMATHSQALFGTEWSATPAQQQRWNALIVNGGRSFLPALDTASGE
jgi:hypothetical protein